MSIKLSVSEGSREFFGQFDYNRRFWWVRSVGAAGAFWDLPDRFPGHIGFTTEDLNLPCGEFVLGCGAGTRIRFHVLPETAAIEIAPNATDRPRVTEILRETRAETETRAEYGTSDPWHVTGYPPADGLTFDGGSGAWSYLASEHEAGRVDASALASNAIRMLPGPSPTTVRIAAPEPQPQPVAVAPQPLPVATVAAGDSYGTRAPIDPPVIVQPQPQPSEPQPSGFTFDTRAGVENESSAARIAQDAADLAALGIVMPPPIYAPGSVVNETGRENIARSHAEWSRQPLAIDVCRDVADLVKAESRIDVETVRNPHMLDNGRIDLGGIGPVAFERSAFDQIVNRHGWFPKGAATLANIQPADRAFLWNKYPPTSGDPITVRTRDTGGTRRAFAIVSPGYTAFDADKVADLVSAAFKRTDGGTTARAEVHMDPGSTELTIDALWHADRVSNFAAGDVFKAGVRISANDSGGGAIRISGIAFRNLCLNLIITSATEGEVTRIVHRGDERSMVRKIAAGLDTQIAAFARFARRWGYVQGTEAIELVRPEKRDQWARAGSRLLAEALARHVTATPMDEDRNVDRLRADLIRLPNVEIDGPRADVVDAIVRGFDREPGDSISALLNSITRIHEDRRLAIPVVRSAEAVAGKLLVAVAR